METRYIVETRVALRNKSVELVHEIEGIDVPQEEEDAEEIELEDERDAQIAKVRLDEIEAHPESVLRTDALETKMKKWQKH